MNSSRRIALTIAGSDSGGGAGIQADLKTFAAWEVYGTSVIVAVTAQNTLGVTAVHPVPGEVIAAQLMAVADDLPPDACKSGMLATRELVELVATSIGARGWHNYICDPVMVATSGDRLLDFDAVSAVRDRLLPLAACVTPNLDEAEILTGRAVRTPDAMADAGKAQVGSGVVVLANTGADGKVGLVVGVTADLVGRFDAVQLVRVGAEALGGKGGGGRPDMAQAGGPEGSSADDALKAIEAALAAA